MNSRRTVILIVAVVVGALAAVGLLNFVKNAETTAGQEAAPVDIWVVKQIIPKGTPIDTAIENQLIGKEQTPLKYRPATAVSQPDQELAGLVAITDLPVNMPILTSSFVSPTVIDTGITDRLEERGLVTVTFTVDPTQGAAYLIEPGDYVNVIVERKWDTPFFEEDPPVDLTESATAELVAELAEHNEVRPLLTDLYPIESRMVYQKAEVLAIDTSLVPDIGQSAVDGADEGELATNRGLVTLAVPPKAVQVILNADRTAIYLSLVPDNYEPRPIHPLDPTTQVLPGEKGFTPYDELTDDVTADQLLFSDAEDRIGTTPGAGSDTADDEQRDGVTPPQSTETRETPPADEEL